MFEVHDPLMPLPSLPGEETGEGEEGEQLKLSGRCPLHEYKVQNLETGTGEMKDTMAGFTMNHHHLSNDNTNFSTVNTSNNTIDNNNGVDYDYYNNIRDEEYYKGLDIADVMMLRSAADSSYSYDDSMRGTGEWVSLSSVRL